MTRLTPTDLTGMRVLIPTSRHVYRLVSYGMVVDFEDAVARASDADLLPVPLRSRRTQVNNLLQGRLPRSVRPPRSRYDVCLLVAMSPDWLPGLRSIHNLRRAADRVVVYLFDSWLGDLPALRSDRRLWSLVDDLFVSFEHAHDAYSSQLPCRVHYLPQAVDSRWFHPNRGDRPIEVLSVGRRLPAVHHRLLELSRRRDLYYYYQTHEAPLAIDFAENQELVGHLCQWSRVHVSWSVDCTNPSRKAEAGAVTARWFESAASGAAVIGRAPRTSEFARLFPYSGFVHELDPTATERTEEILDKALADPRHVERKALAEHVRRTHTWSVRWRQIVDVCGL